MGASFKQATSPRRNINPGRGDKHPPVNFYLFCLVLACLIPGLTGAFAMVMRQNERQRGALEATTVQTARALTQAIDSQVVRRQSILEGLVTSDAAQRKDFHALYRRMQQILIKPGFASRFSITGIDGQLIANTTVPEGQHLPKHGNPAHIEEVVKSKQPVVSGVFLGELHHDRVVTVSVPVIIQDETAYVLSATLQPDLFTRILKDEGLPSEWRVAVLDREGKFIARIRGNDDLQAADRNDNLWKGMKDAPEGAFETTTLDGEQILAVYSRSKVTGWTVIVGIPLAPLQAGYQTPFYLLLAGIGALFSLVVTLAWWMSDRISHSIRALLVPAQQLGQGKPVDFPLVHIDEAQELAQALINASDLLRERNEALDAEKNSRLRQLEQMVAERTEALEAAMKASQAQARNDALTGVMNRLAADEQLQHEFLRMKRSGQAYSALLFDIDHFKQVNDTYGHETGDQVLKTVAALMKNNVRMTDFVFRYGGEEFLVLLPSTGLEGAQVIAEKIRLALESHSFGSWLKITISLGVSMARPEDATDHELIRRADVALYAAINGGRNQVQVG